MYVSVSRLRVPEDRSEELVAAFRDRAHRVSHDRVDPDLHRAIRLDRLEQLHDTYEVVAR